MDYVEAYNRIRKQGMSKSEAVKTVMDLAGSNWLDALNSILQVVNNEKE